jgi:sugar lactone lactonase YvrE
MRIRPHAAKAEVWIKPGAFGSRSLFGVLADEKSGTLWVCSEDLSMIGIPGPSSEAGSALKGFDLKTGAGKVSVPLPGDHAACNDIAIGPDGSAFITNTIAPQILRLPPGGKQLQIWKTDLVLQAPPGAAGLDGIAFGSDGNLYVDTYTPGELYRIDVENGKAGKVTKLHPSRPLVLADAIRPLGKDSFLIVEGGGKLDKLLVTGDEASIETLQDGFATPTGVAIVGHTAWVTEGQLSYAFDPSKKSQKPPLPFRVYSVGLP